MTISMNSYVFETLPRQDTQTDQATQQQLSWFTEVKQSIAMTTCLQEAVQMQAAPHEADTKLQRIYQC